MKKNLTILTIAVVVIGVLSCDRDNDNGNGNGTKPAPFTITAVVYNGNDYNNLISGVVAKSITRSYAMEVIASANYFNGGFTITLPATLDDKFLFSNPFSRLEASGFTISDKNARVTHFFDGMTVLANSGDNEIIGLFVHRDLNNFDAHLEGFFMYADRDVTITGTHRSVTPGGLNHTETWLVFLRKGWNKVYFKGTSEEQEITSMYVTEPIFGELNWYFFEIFWDNFAGIPGSAEAVPSVIPSVARNLSAILNNVH